ncbi:MAG: hypothetical protein OJF62_002544 [Pseudolabrys sp.]|nr:hypothetical protein [Pseudolabrys sp.]
MQEPCTLTGTSSSGSPLSSGDERRLGNVFSSCRIRIRCSA